MTDNKTTLKQELGFWDLMGAAVGQIIGAGIMALTGIAIAMTGRSVPLAFILSAVMVLITSLPIAMLNTVARFEGGIYSIIASMFNKKYTGVYTILFVLQNLSLSMYCLSFADYALPFVPMLPRKLLAIGLLLIIYILNMLGIDKFSKFQNIIVSCLVLALTIFTVYGILNMNFSTYYEPETFFTDGILGFLTASAQLTFATGGATLIANLSAEAKNPTRDIPKVIIISTISVAVLYAFMATVAAGILPLSQVAGEPLTHVAKTILPKVLYVFFIVGGAWTALISTLNSQLASCTKPLIQAARDGWIPKKLSYIHPSYRTPIYLLSFFFIVGLLPIVFNINISTISRTVTLTSSFSYAMVILGFYNMTKKFSKNWEKSFLFIRSSLSTTLVVAALLVYALQALLMCRSLPTHFLIGNIIVIIGAFIFANIRYKSNSVNVLDSYTLKE
ncbi:MAG: APC family permease [Fusobacterium sp.]|uniref:APC family permease n=1 Tax=Fusobacterium sp. TaxID=68766 RepID=UPI0026DC3CBE|nr:APC family permease [Fusobacterium sp.]MDO4690398.1 APC family permease [Fusobacterium sp.]